MTEPIAYRLAVGDDHELIIQANEENSRDQLEVKAGEQYRFSCPPGSRWVDSVFPCGPNGFFNLLAWIAGLRVRGVKCFCLCGSYNKDDKTAFRIGAAATHIVTQNGLLSFFANDTPGYYGNNKKFIKLQAQRLT